MSDNSDERHLRRVGRKDRKDRLPPSAPLFPADTPDPLPPLSEPDFAMLLPDTDSEALQSLAASSSQAVRPLNIAPAEERFPPIRPESALPVQPEAKPTAAPNTEDAVLRRGRNGFYNVVTLIAGLGTLALCAAYSVIWVEPRSWLNPFPPDVPYVYVTATPGAAPDVILPNGSTPAPLEATPFGAEGFPFVLADTGTVFIANENGRACDWASIAGSVTAMNGAALNGYRIRVTGVDFDETVFTGAALTFGAGGYELPLGNAPVAGDFLVQLFSPQGAPLSEQYLVTTRLGCESNVAIMNFVQSRNL
jgi:hypothetical protein